MATKADYIPQWKRRSFDAPIRSWSMQQGGYIFIEQGGQEIRIDPFELRDLLYGHTDADYFRDAEEDEADEASQDAGTP